MLTALDLVSTAVPLLHSTDLSTQVGLSGDDPLSLRHEQEVYRVFLSLYGSDGRFMVRRPIGTVASGERRLVDLSAMTRAETGPRDCLAVVHRVPSSICPEGESPEQPLAAPPDPGFELYRTMVQFSREGGQGAVIYETPPGLNDSRERAKTSKALMFTSMARVTPRADTRLVVIHHSLDPAYQRTAGLELCAFDGAGTPAGTTRVDIGAFQVAVVSVADMVDGQGGTYSLVGWSQDAALIFLVLQLDDSLRSVTVEHTHPPQTYLMSVEPPRRFRQKDQSIAQWVGRPKAEVVSR